MEIIIKFKYIKNKKIILIEVKESKIVVMLEILEFISKINRPKNYEFKLF